MQFVNSSAPGYNAGLAMDPYGNQRQFTQTQNPYGYSQQAPQMIGTPQRPINPIAFETPQITMGENHKPLFKTAEEVTIKVDNLSDADKERKRRKKSSDNTLPVTKNDNIVKVGSEDKATKITGTVEDLATIYSYGETNNLLHETLGQIDAINAELVQEFDAVRHNRTLKNKYNILNDLSANIGSLIANRISAIREINSCISKANDMDYKKYKDREAAASTMSDDKYISDLYQAFIQQPQNMAPQYQMPMVDPSIMGSGIVRANITQDQVNNPGQPIADAGYLNYLAHLTPEQNMMRYENNPDVKQVVVYDAQTGAKFFQVMNVKTGEVIPNVPVYDQMFMEDTTLDIKKRIAKNINLNEEFPIIIINDNITSQY